MYYLAIDDLVLLERTGESEQLIRLSQSDRVVNVLPWIWLTTISIN